MNENSKTNTIPEEEVSGFSDTVSKSDSAVDEGKTYDDNQIQVLCLFCCFRSFVNSPSQ